MESETCFQDHSISSGNRAWGAPVRIAFRFSFCYLLLYMLPAPGRLGILEAIPGGSTLASPFVWLWQTMLPWVAQHGLHLSGPAYAKFSNAGADKALTYVQIFVMLNLALIATLCWSIVARQRSYPELNTVLRLLVRAFLFVGLLPFGLDKIIPVQFPSPPMLSRLVQPLGEFSTAGLLWNFMGASATYEILSGVAETVAACLLLFRRTTTLGALLTAAVMLNVVALNYCYDLAVKTYSSHLLVMSLFLLAPDLGRFADIFLFHRTACIEPDPRLPLGHTFRSCSKAVAIVCICWFSASTAAEFWKGYLKMLSWRTEDPLYGIYEVESFSRGGVQVAPLLTDSTRWRAAYSQSPTSFAFMHMDNTWDWYFARFDPVAHSLALHERGSRSQIGNLTYRRPDDAHVLLEGQLIGEHVAILLRSDPTKTRLLDARFHWIHETPPSAQ